MPMYSAAPRPLMRPWEMTCARLKKKTRGYWFYFSILRVGTVCSIQRAPGTCSCLIFFTSFTSRMRRRSRRKLTLPMMPAGTQQIPTMNRSKLFQPQSGPILRERKKKQRRSEGNECVSSPRRRCSGKKKRKKKWRDQRSLERTGSSPGLRPRRRSGRRHRW
jgi:hypothetical protein